MAPAIGRAFGRTPVNSIASNTTGKRVLVTGGIVLIIAFVIIAALWGWVRDGEAIDDPNINELTLRGFEDIQRAGSDGGAWGSYYASFGQCRATLKHTEGEGWTLEDRSSRGEEHDLIVPDPTVPKLGQIDSLQYCFEDEGSTDQVEPSPEESDVTNT